MYRFTGTVGNQSIGNDLRPVVPENPYHTHPRATWQVRSTTKRRWSRRTICEGCHVDIKPDLPTEGEFGELTPTAADFEKPDVQ